MSGIVRFKDLCMDAADHQAQATWLVRGTGLRPSRAGGRSAAATGGSGADRGSRRSGTDDLGEQVPEAKVVKNRMHIDVFGRLDELLAAGATLVRAKDDDIDWDVMAAPKATSSASSSRDAWLAPIGSSRGGLRSKTARRKRNYQGDL